MRWLRRGVNEFQATKRHLTELGANPVCPAGLTRSVTPAIKLHYKASRVWRKGWDSNPRYPCRHAGFQDRCLKPLGHPSVVPVMSEPVPDCKGRPGAAPRAGAGGSAPRKTQRFVYHPGAVPISAAFRLRYIHTLMRKWAASGTRGRQAHKIIVRPV